MMPIVPKWKQEIQPLLDRIDGIYNKMLKSKYDL